MRSIGANIKAKRRELGLNQEDLARKLGLTQANVSRIEANVKGPSADLLLSIADVLECDVRELLGIMEEQKGNVPELDQDSRAFVLHALENDPQLGVFLRRFVKSSEDLTDEDWKFVSTSLKLALGFASDAIKAKRLKGDF